jgi:hypothetical protein
MNPVDAFVKSLNRDRQIAFLIAACGCFAGVICGLATDYKFFNPSMKQFIPLIYTMALIPMSHGLLTMRLMNAVTTLAASSKPQAPETR